MENGPSNEKTGQKHLSCQVLSCFFSWCPDHLCSGRQFSFPALDRAFRSIWLMALPFNVVALFKSTEEENTAIFWPKRKHSEQPRCRFLMPRPFRSVYLAAGWLATLASAIFLSSPPCGARGDWPSSRWGCRPALHFAPPYIGVAVFCAVDCPRFAERISDCLLFHVAK